MHYLEDWAGAPAALRRVLRPGGRLIVSVDHPAAYRIVYPAADYFVVMEHSEDYVFDETVWLTFWHRPRTPPAHPGPEDRDRHPRPRLPRSRW